MKTLFTLFCSGMVAGAAWAQIPNPSFESWTAGDPNSWGTSNEAAPSVSQVADAHDGSSAARLEAFNVDVFTFGAALLGENFSQNEDQEALRGWYKANFVGGDILNITTYLTDAGDGNVRLGSSDLTASTNVYTEFVVNMDPVSGNAPVTGTISFIILSATSQLIGVNLGTYVIVDDLSWGEQGVGVDEYVQKGLALETIFPNPSNGNPAQVQFNIDRNADVVMDVVDMTGRTVMSVLNQHMGPGHYRADLPTSMLAPGTYCCRMIVGEEVRTLRFVN